MGMSCRNVVQLRDRHLDGDLSPSLSAEVHAHLLQCPACQRQHELYRATGEVIARDRSEPRLTDDFTARLLAAIESSPRRRPMGPVRLQTRRALRERFWRLAFSVSVPAAAAMLFLGVMIWPTSEPVRNNGLVAGVSIRATDVVGMNEVADPAVSAVAETVRAAGSITEVQRLLVDQARLGVEERSLVVEPEMTLLRALLLPFSEVLDPSTQRENDKNTTPAADDVVRF